LEKGAETFCRDVARQELRNSGERGEGRSLASGRPEC
jgi:hypothetical protein